MRGTFSDNTLTMSSTDTSVPIAMGVKLALRGVNLSGAKAGQGQDHMIKLSFWILSYEDALAYLQAGVNTVRFPIRWGISPLPISQALI